MSVNLLKAPRISYFDIVNSILFLCVIHINAVSLLKYYLRSYFVYNFELIYAPRGDTELFDVVPVVLQRDTLVLYLFIIFLD